jgi:hypothetical protein
MPAILLQIFCVGLAEAAACILWNQENFLTLAFLYAAFPALVQMRFREPLFVSTFAVQPLVALSLPTLLGYQYSFLLVSWLFLPVVALGGVAGAWYGRRLLERENLLPVRLPTTERAPTSPV